MKGDKTFPIEYSFNTFANVMYIDQPASVGFSKGTTPTNSVDAAKSTRKALESFFNKYQTYNSKVFLVGQSYAGHYIPALAEQMLQDKSPIRLRGVILGNSLVSSQIQFSSMPTMALKSGTVRSVISKAEYDAMVKDLPLVIDSMQQCLAHRDDVTLCKRSFDTYYGTLVDPVRRQNIDTYDLRLKCVKPFPECRNTEKFTTFFNNPRVQEYLGVSKVWMKSSKSVGEAFLGDMPVDYSSSLAKILDRGLKDYICNWIGSRQMAMAIQWAGKEGFSKAPDSRFFTRGGNPIGKLKTFTFKNTGGQLNFAQVFQAGHSAAEDSPAGVLQLVDNFVFGRYR
ncbi:hypothetical protein FOL47_010085 [Perkinsus chesapeaki]|uniref:Thymus-specific serine protease n=1 Tax=Perkinsus chesapeaki TaxID=330153 RepID=A0A7J6L4W3_PERCH|nr:hypothetical protein FOL47_010085 [Perkinsus chesapeaki]